jgi:hypothetical protein
MSRRGSVLGIHAIKFQPEMFSKLLVEQARQLYNSQMFRVSDYLRKMGIPDRIVELMWANSSANIRYLTTTELETFPDIETVIEEMKIARCGVFPGGATPPEILEPYGACVDNIHTENLRTGAGEYLRANGSYGHPR